METGVFEQYASRYCEVVVDLMLQWRREESKQKGESPVGNHGGGIEMNDHAELI